MSEPNDGQAVSLPKTSSFSSKGYQARYTAETVLRTCPKTYRKIVHLLADPNWSAIRFLQVLRLRAILCAPSDTVKPSHIAERKKSLVAMLANVAELRGPAAWRKRLARLVAAMRRS